MIFAPHVFLMGSRLLDGNFPWRMGTFANRIDHISIRFYRKKHGPLYGTPQKEIVRQGHIEFSILGEHLDHINDEHSTQISHSIVEFCST